MKNLKVNFIALVALVIGIVTMSFKLSEDTPKVDLSSNDLIMWYYTETTDTNHDNPAKYVLATGNEDCPNLSNVRCTILAPDDGTGQPDLSQASNFTYKR